MAAVFNIRMRDGTLLGDVASIASNKRLKRRLNRPSECHFRVPSYLVSDVQSDGRPLICAGYRQVEVTLDETGLFFHGIIWTVQDDGDEDMVYTSVTAYDPMMVWRFRPARDDVDSYSGDAGNFSDPSFIERNVTGPLIMQEILTASENVTRIPALAEGQLFLDLATSTFAGGGADLRGAPVDWPMSIAEVASLLMNTGELDCVIEPLNGGVGAQGFQNMGRVHCLNGNYGTDLTASVNFDYATGDFTIRQMRRSDDMSIIGNKLWYFLGPRLDQQHWRSNVTADHPELENPPGGKVFPAPVGPLGTAIDASRDDLGVYMLISIYDNFGSGSDVEGAESSAYPLFLRQWQIDSLLRLAPRTMVYVTPARGVGIGDFDIGDLITVNIGARARVASSGAQRIYSYEIEIDDDAVPALGEFECSPDQDSI